MRLNIMLLALALFSSLNASELFTVSGEITVHQKGKICLFLITEQEFKTYEPAFKQEFDLSQDSIIFNDSIRTRTVRFVFRDVPAGIYGIRCFQDLNGNGRIDMGLFGPKEPWGMYKKFTAKLRPPRFKDIKFNVDQNISDVHIDCR